jgi:hypothetical protein
MNIGSVLKSELQALMIIAIAGGISITVLAFSAPPIIGPCLDCPAMVHETVIMQSYVVNSPTNVTLTLRNTGLIRVALVAYKVAEPSGVYFANTTWTGPTIDPNQVATANILISGTAFTFQSSTSYTITITTSRNTQLQFAIIG